MLQKKIQMETGIAPENSLKTLEINKGLGTKSGNLSGRCMTHTTDCLKRDVVLEARDAESE